LNTDEWEDFVSKIEDTVESNPDLDEANTKSRIISPLLKKLGWDPLEGEVRAEYPIKFATRTSYVDYALMVERSPAVFVEAKALRSDISSGHAKQLIDYGRHKGVNWCVLTNGKELRIYNSAWMEPEEERTQDALVEGVRIDQFIDKVDIIEKISKESITSGKTGQAFKHIKQTNDAIDNLKNNRREIEENIEGLLDSYVGELIKDKVSQATSRFIKELIDELAEYPQEGVTIDKPPERNWSKCKKREDFEERINNILETITVSNKYDKQKGYIEPELDELKRISLNPVEIGDRYGLRVDVHPGDTMGQSKSLYKNPDFTMESIEKLKEKGWGFEPDFTVFHAHSHIVHFDTKSHKEKDYFQFWSDNIDLLKQRDQEELLSKLDEFAELDLIVIDEDTQEEIRKKIVESNRNVKFSICPGIFLYYDFKFDEAARLDNKGEFEGAIKKRMREVVGALGKTCDFIDF